MTRDSKWWWLVIAGAVATSLMSRWDVIDPLLPAAHTDRIHAFIELVALVAGIIAGKMATSPLPGNGDKERVRLDQ